jgi:hypothetical protein
MPQGQDRPKKALIAEAFAFIDHTMECEGSQ